MPIFKDLVQQWRFHAVETSDKCDEECEKPFLESGSLSDRENAIELGHRRSRNIPIVLIAINVLLFLASCVSWWNILRHGRHERNQLLKDTSYYSPMLDTIDIPMSTWRINGSLFQEDAEFPSVYREDPSPEVDAAWDRLSNTATLVISSDIVSKLGKDPSQTARYPEDWGFGPNAHVGALDGTFISETSSASSKKLIKAVFHQIHCLNMLRKEAFFDYYYSEVHPDGKPSESHKGHTSHCIYVLLQNLMCSASVDVMTHRWVDVQKHPVPDFNMNKQCRDFEAIVQWNEQNVVNATKYLDLRRPLDAPFDIASDEFKRIMNQMQYTKNNVEQP